MTTDSHHRLHRRAGERGFTLVELMIVMLLIGILSAIAIPAFLHQRNKGYDTEAQRMARSTAIALTTFETDNDTFDATRAQLEAIEPTLTEARALTHSGTETDYEVAERSRSGITFRIARAGDGRVTRTCDRPGDGLCRGAADAAGNWW